MTVWRAPGRINLIGEHTDYNDGFALPFALARACTTTISDAPHGLTAGSAQQPDSVEVPVAGVAASPDVPGWARYVLGAAWLLVDRGVDVPPLDLAVDSDVPLGAGLASSAALVCSVVCALDDHLGLDLGEAGRLALSREVENVVVGAPTGGMDQLASLRSVAGHALWCDMRTLEATPVPLDLTGAGLEIVVVDTRAPHRHSDGDYAERRQWCEAAAQALGVPALRDVATDDLGQALRRLDNDALRRCVRHVVTEDQRVLDTVARLRAGDVAGIGALLTASHDSMREDFRITVPEVDTAVDALLDAGALGARMTGGGFGGCVIALVEQGRRSPVESGVRQAFAAAGFAEPEVFTAAPQGGAGPLLGE